MKNVLIMCNSVYHIMIAFKLLCLYDDCKVDILITDHLNNAKKISERIKNLSLFENVYYAETFKYARGKSFVSKNRLYNLYISFNAKKVLKSMFIPDKNYDIILGANCDRFTNLLFSVMKRKNKALKFILFEDGLSTYSKLFEVFYKSTMTKKLRRKILLKALGLKTLYGNIEKLYVFEPKMICWSPEFPVEKLSKINKNDEALLKKLNYVFSYDESPDIYDKKIIFIEESFCIEEENNYDIELVEQIAEIVGKENIMVKIHPRNPVNRFEKLGYKTNKNTSVPWELIVMNCDMHDKLLVTIASSSIINPLRLFGERIKAVSLYKCLSDVPKTLEGHLWDCAKKMFDKYPQDIIVCDDVDHLRKIINNQFGGY